MTDNEHNYGEITRHWLRNKKNCIEHEQVQIREANRSARVDKGLEGLIKDLWSVGIETCGSCIEAASPEAKLFYVQLQTFGDLQRLFSVMESFKPQPGPHPTMEFGVRLVWGERDEDNPFMPAVSIRGPQRMHWRYRGDRSAIPKATRRVAMRPLGKYSNAIIALAFVLAILAAGHRIGRSNPAQVSVYRDGQLLRTLTPEDGAEFEKWEKIPAESREQ